MSKEDIERLDALIAGLTKSHEELRKTVEDLKKGAASSQAANKNGGRSPAQPAEAAPADATTSLLAAEPQSENEGVPADTAIEAGFDGTPADVAVTGASLDLGRQFELNQSIWDISMFIGHPCLGCGVSVVLSLAYVLNLGLQLYFCYIVYRFMLEPDIDVDKLQSLLRFRLGIGHSVMFADLVAEQSLMAQVCSEDFGLAVAGGKVDLHGALTEFHDGGHGLMVLVMVLWLSSVMKELDATRKCASALLQVPRVSQGMNLILCDGNSLADFDENHVISVPSITTRVKGISMGRVACSFSFVLVPRALIALILGYVGVRWLGKTSSMGDLVLNAVALAFVTDLDELIYEIFAPSRAVVLMSNLEPLRRRSVVLGKVTWLPSVLKMLLVAGALGIVHVTILTPFFWTLTEAQSVMCSGETDFVFAKNEASGVIHVAKSKDNKANWTEDEKTVFQVAGPVLDDKLFNSSLSQAGSAVLMSRSTAANISEAQYDTRHFQAVRLLAGATLAESAELLACRDLGDVGNKYSTLRNLRVLMQNNTITSCHDVPWQACTRHDMTKLRALCPIRCNCHKDPTYTWGYSGYFRTPAGGCPAQCATLAASFAEIKYSKHYLWVDKGFQGCEDVEPEKLIFNGSCVDADQLKNPEVRDNISQSCSVYEPGWCGTYDTSSFNASDLCCVCGGGIRDVKTSAECFDDLTDSCQNMNLEAFWFLTYITGMFQVKLADQFFGAGVENIVSLPSAPAGNTHRQSKNLTAHVTSGQMAKSMLDGEWTFMPGMPHPRGLKGCDYITSNEFKALVNVDVCSSRQFSSIKFLCPRSCGCKPALYNDIYFESPEKPGSYKDVSEALLFSNKREDLSECPTCCLLAHPYKIGDLSWIDDLKGCSDDNSWTDWKYGDGTVDCYKVSRDRWKWCTEHGDWSDEATRACPWTCGSCQVEGCADIGDSTDMRGYDCYDYFNNMDACAGYDDSDFTATQMCCSCGGGDLVEVCEDDNNLAVEIGSTYGLNIQSCADLASDCDNVEHGYQIRSLCCATCSQAKVSCQNTDASASDAHGDSCDWYDSIPTGCGRYDDIDFSSNSMCCACGRGDDPTQVPCQNTDASASDADGDSCDWYDSTPTGCGRHDDIDFSSNSMCCACGRNDDPTQACQNTDASASDVDGDSCDHYDRWPSACGGFDDTDFSSISMCCACDGGDDPTQATT